MAKSRAQRKAEAARKRRLAEQGIEVEREDESRAQHDTQVPESAYELEAELAIEHGAEETPDEALGNAPDDALDSPAPVKADRREERRRRLCPLVARAAHPGPPRRGAHEGPGAAVTEDDLVRLEPLGGEQERCAPDGARHHQEHPVRPAA